MNKILICPFCSEVVKRNMDECSKCGATRVLMEKEILKRKNQEIADKEKVQETVDETKEQAKQNVDENKNEDVKQDVDGKINIKTDDVTLLPSSYSVKKARGQDNPKWWEFYKHIDNILARRKIMKEVNKEGRVYPEGKKKWKLLLLTILFGYLGVQNFYATNTKKGWVQLAFFTVAIIFSNIQWKFLVTTGLDWLVFGCLGFICVYWWFADIINIIINRFIFAKSKNEFISKLNFNTRSKLGKKYIK